MYVSLVVKCVHSLSWTNPRLNVFTPKLGKKPQCEVQYLRKLENAAVKPRKRITAAFILGKYPEYEFYKTFKIWISQ